MHTVIHDRRRTAPPAIWVLLFCSLSILGMVAVAQPKAPLVKVELAEAASLIEEVPLSGSVISPRIARLSTEVSGLVEAMVIEIGDRVDTGDEILRLNAELARLTLTAAEAATEQASLEMEDAKRRLADARELAKRQGVSANEIESLAAEVRIDGAQVKRLRAEQQRQAANLRRHTLRAPFAGVISRRLVEQGEWLTPGDAVAELVATTDPRIDFQVPQTVYAKLGQTADLRVRLDALPGRTFEGRVDSVIPVTDPASRTFMIRVALNNGIDMTPGMSASAVLRLQTGTQGVVVSRDALLRYPDGRITLWVVEGQGDQARVSEHQVETGLSFNGKIAIGSGLAVGARVVVQGNEALREGQAVSIQEAE